MTKDDQDFNKIFKISGVVLLVLGVLSIWRGIFRLMPYAGFRPGLTFTLIGCAITAVGIGFLVYAHRQVKKWEKMRAEQAAQDGQAKPTEQDQ